jgi:hypothetical protein
MWECIFHTEGDKNAKRNWGGGGESEIQRPLGRRRYRGEDNIKNYLKK